MSLTLNKLEDLHTQLLQDLEMYERQLQRMNAEISEYHQLKSTIVVIERDLREGFKTQVNVGANVFMKAKVPTTDKILINVGMNHYVEFSLEEALKFVDFRIRVLTKQNDVIREAIIKTKAKIKLALLCVQQ
ncbi:protein UXT homolog [Lutzomyia longipalpis]|uniref:Putative prefoldin is a hexameric molecular chaperone complex n=1 Tax=Lutzomyia longipalpis TaxID=7200 RepID=A0A1B0CKG8_LUTLO|nr:protein UXT homolog [Lutzomyia longipalpis]